MASKSKLISAVVLRLANVYGPSSVDSLSQDRGILSKVTQMCFELNQLKLYGEKEYLRDYIYIDDVIDSFLVASTMRYDNLINKGNISINIASGKGSSVSKAFKLISKEVEKNLDKKIVIKNVPWPKQSNEIEKRNFVASVELMNSLTGWKSKVSLEEGIKLLVEHHKRKYKNNEAS